MDTQLIKQKLLSGDMTDEELSALLDEKSGSHKNKPRGNFLKTILKGFVDAYTAPAIWRLALQTLLILLSITGVVALSYLGKIDAAMTAIIMAFILGFLFGKIK
jgi:hypothetical protein